MTALDRIGALLRGAHIDAELAAPSAIARVVDERRRATGAGDLLAYAELAERDPAEALRLRAMVTVPETWLFRYPASFELLRARIAAGRPRSFRALCVACATGAEPFSVAATAIAGGVPAVQVLGIDPNPEALAQARAADLGPLAARGGIPTWARGLVSLREGGEPVLEPAVRAAVELRAGEAPEALADLPDGSFDAVFCRNLAIYLSPEGRRAIGSRLAALAAPGAPIFLGHAERASHFGLEDSWEPARDAEPGSFAICRRERPAGARERTAERLSAAGRAPARIPPGTGRPGAKAPAPRAAGAASAALTPSAAQPATATLDAVRELADRGELADALAAARALHESGARDVPLLELLGTLHLALGEHARAEEALRQALYLDPSNEPALVQLAVLAERRGDAELAERYRARAAGGSS